jgi:hypothetical protein
MRKGVKNGRTLIWSQTRGNIERNLDSGRITKSNRKLIQPQLLQEIRNYLPEKEARQAKEKESVRIVGNESPINLPPEIKNEILHLLGRYPENENQFPEDYENEKENNKKENNQKAGRSRKSTSTFKKGRTKSTSTLKKKSKTKKYALRKGRNKKKL